MMMNKKEATKILAMVKANYTHEKIENAEATVSAWVLNLGNYPAIDVFNAARLHMEVSTFFPTTADIKKKIERAKLIYQDAGQEAGMLEAGQVKKECRLEAKAGSGEDVKEYINKVLNDLDFPE